MTKYYVDTEGNYLGGFDGASPPSGASEVAAPPIHGWQTLSDGDWQPINASEKTELTANLSQDDIDTLTTAGVIT